MTKMPEGDINKLNSSFVAKSVLLRGGTPWGFRIQGGRDTGFPLRISRINPNSKAALEGVKEGDVIEAINGRPASQLNHREAHQIIRDTLHYLRLSLKRNISCSSNKNRKSAPPVAMFRSSTCIEVNSPTAEPSEQLPHSTTLIFKSGGRGPITRKSSGEAVIEGELPLERCSSLDSQSTVASDTCNSTSSISKKDHPDNKGPTLSTCTPGGDSGHFLPPPPDFSDADLLPQQPQPQQQPTLASPPDEFRDFIPPRSTTCTASERRGPLSPADDDRWKLRIKRFAATVQLSICSSTPGSSPCLSVDEADSAKSTSGTSSPAKQQSTPVKCRRKRHAGSSEDLPKLYYRRAVGPKTPLQLRRIRSDEGQSSSVQSEDFSEEEIPEDDSEYPLQMLSSTSLSSEDDRSGSVISEDLPEDEMYAGRIPPHERMDRFCQRKAFSEGFLEQRPRSGTLLQLRRNPSAELITVSIPPQDNSNHEPEINFDALAQGQGQGQGVCHCEDQLQLSSQEHFRIIDGGDQLIPGTGTGNDEVASRTTTWKIPTLNILGASMDLGSPERSPDPASGGDTSISSMDTVMTVLQRKFSPSPSSLSSGTVETAREQPSRVVPDDCELHSDNDDDDDIGEEPPEEVEEEKSEATVGTQTETPPAEPGKSLADAAQQTDTEEEPSTLEDLASLKTEIKSPSSAQNELAAVVFPRSSSFESRSDTPSPSNSASNSAGVAGEDHSSLEHTLTDISDIPSQYTHAPLARSATIHSDDPDEIDDFLEITISDDHVDSVSLRSPSSKGNQLDSDDEGSKTLVEDAEGTSSRTLDGRQETSTHVLSSTGESVPKDHPDSARVTKPSHETNERSSSNSKDRSEGSSLSESSKKNFAVKASDDSKASIVDSASKNATDPNKELIKIRASEERVSDCEKPSADFAKDFYDVPDHRERAKDRVDCRLHERFEEDHGSLPLPPCPSAEDAVLEYKTLDGNLEKLKEHEDVSLPPKATPTAEATNGDVTNSHPNCDQTANDSAKHSQDYKSPGKFVWSPYNKSTVVRESPEAPKIPPTPPQPEPEPKTPERPQAPSQNAQLAWKPFGIISTGNSLDSQSQARHEDAVTSHEPVPPETFSGKFGGKQPPSVPPKATSTSSRTTISSLSSSSVPSSPPAPALPPLPSFNRIRLPPSQSPTITLLQKAREGHIPKGTVYIDHKMTDRDESGSGREMPITRTGTGPHDTIYAVKYEESQAGRRIIHKEPKQYIGIGPTEHGVPVGLRTGVKEENKGEWYKRMYKSLHRAEHDDDYLVVKYRRPGRIPYSTHSGYMSEPEPDRREDYDHWRSATLDRRRGNESPQTATSRTLPKERQKPVYPQWTPPSARYRADIYRNQPKRIEDYEPGRSSIAEMIAKSDEDINQVGNMSADYWMAPSRPLAASSLAHPLSYWYSMLQMQKKEPRQTVKNTSHRPAYPFLYKDGYESDSTLVYRKQMDINGHSPVTQMTPTEQRERYKDIQKGGEIPLTGFRRPAPEKPKERPSACMSPTEHAPVPLIPTPSSVTTPAPVLLRPKKHDSETQTEMMNPSQTVSVPAQYSTFPISFSLPNLLAITPLPLFSVEAFKKVAVILSNQLPSIPSNLSLPIPPNRKSSLKALTPPSSAVSSFGSTDISILCASTPSLPSVFPNSMSLGDDLFQQQPPERPPLPLTFLVNETDRQMHAPPIPIPPTVPNVSDDSLDHLTTVPEGSDSSSSESLMKNVGDSETGVECCAERKGDRDTQSQSQALAIPETLVKYDDPVPFDPNMHLHLRILVDVPTPPDQHSWQCTSPQQANHSSSFTSYTRVSPGRKQNMSNVDLLFQAVEASVQGDWVLSGNPQNVYQHLIMGNANLCTPPTTPEDGGTSSTDLDRGQSRLELLLVEMPTRNVSYAPKRCGTMTPRCHSRSLCDLSLSPRLAGTNLTYRDYIASFLPAPRSSERFVRLRQYYAMLDRIGQLEKGTHLARSLSRSSAATKAFSKLAARSVPELEKLYGELERAQQGKDFLFRAKSPEEVRWIGDKDRGLCRRTNSVQDLRKKFSKMPKSSLGISRRNSDSSRARSISVADMVQMYNQYEEECSSGMEELPMRSKSCIVISKPPPDMQIKRFASSSHSSATVIPMASQAKSVAAAAAASNQVSPKRSDANTLVEPTRKVSSESKNMRSRSLPRHFVIRRPPVRSSRRDIDSSGSVPCSSVDNMNDPVADSAIGTARRGRGNTYSSLSRLNSGSVSQTANCFSRGYVPERTVSTVDLRAANKHPTYTEETKFPEKRVTSSRPKPDSEVPVRKESFVRMSHLLGKSGAEDRQSTRGSSSSSASYRGNLKETKQSGPRGCVARWFLDPASDEDDGKAKQDILPRSSKRRKKISSERRQLKGESKTRDDSSDRKTSKDEQRIRRKKKQVEVCKQLPFRTGSISTGQVATAATKYEKLSYQPDDEVFLSAAPWSGGSSTDSWMWISKSVPCLGSTTKISDCHPVLRELKEMFKNPKFPRQKVFDDSVSPVNRCSRIGDAGDNKELITSSSAGDVSECHDEYSSPNGLEDEESSTNKNIEALYRDNFSEFTKDKHSSADEPNQCVDVLSSSSDGHLHYKDDQTHSNGIRSEDAKDSESSSQSKDVGYIDLEVGQISSSKDLEQDYSKDNRDIGHIPFEYDTQCPSADLNPCQPQDIGRIRFDDETLCSSEDLDRDKSKDLGQVILLETSSYPKVNPLRDIEKEHSDTKETIYDFDSQSPIPCNALRNDQFESIHSNKPRLNINEAVQSSESVRSLPGRTRTPNLRCSKEIFRIGLVGVPKVSDNDRNLLLRVSKSVSSGYGDCCTAALAEHPKSYTYIPLISSTPTSARTSPFPRSSSCSSPPSTTATSSPIPSPGRYEHLLDIPCARKARRDNHQIIHRHQHLHTDGSGQVNASTISPPSASSPARTARAANAHITSTSASGACDDFSDFDFDFNLDFNNLVAPPPKVPLVDKDSARRYQESEVNIHYRSPIRAAEKEYMSEEELRRRQEETMRQLYEVERKKKALQELSDLESRRHSDNIPPSQKSPIPLNRYDNTYDTSTSPVPRARTLEPKTVARALFNFTAQNTKELSFSKGDIIFIHRQVDKNWYEGEHHGLFGWFPVNYVEIIPYDNVRPLQAKRSSEGQARAKFTFRAQSPMELSFVKGESVIITRRVDNNWFEGRVGLRRGIFPVCYVDVLLQPSETNGSVSPPAKPVASPVSHSLIMNGSNYSPNANNYQLPSKHGPKMQTYISAPIPYTAVRKIPPRSVETYYEDRRLPVDQSLHVDTHSDHIPYRALYNYQPQNDDELELVEGDIVYVMEKCDDGWYVGTSSKSGLFGTFPGNYVERIKF